MAEGKRCHGGETKMVPRQHSDDPTTRREVGAKESGRERAMQDGGVLPNSGFPLDDGMAKEGHCKDNSITVQNASISYNTQAFVHGRSSRGYTSEACILGQNEFEVEVVVHGP